MEDWQGEFAILALGIFSILLIALYFVTIYKAWVGTQYSIVLWLSTLLLISNFGFLIEALGFWIGFKIQELLEQNDFAGFGASVGNLCLGEAHWILAVFYFKLAHNMPLVIAGQSDQVRGYKTMLWIGAIPSGIFPVLSGIFWAIGNKQYRAKGEDSIAMSILLQCSTFFSGLMMLITSLIMIFSILKICKFMKSRSIKL